MRHFPLNSSRQEAHAATQARLKQKLERLKELPLLPWIGDHANPNLALQTRHSMWNIIFFALVIINTWMLAARSAVAPWRHNAQQKNLVDGKNKKK